MLQKLQKFLEVAQKTASCPKVAEQLVDRAISNHATGLNNIIRKSEPGKDCHTKGVQSN